ncbi:PepSY domain-containing protein [Pusillimonas noertemannii]|uniref:PepSY-associated transmembrane protein n=1 Tax=Pusillimonas noertemannii TaxID=305977 RepID=A0A2U1CQC9_9BURK|nr:PepSY domain-containing protein [Pusillimonas noertemannii]NYT67420.1 PepSY domain-containing protein [Pusillimonas noertemannii]PVY68093.1 PepSY-associated transmembrane protein [Pusillimonas noertemannii]TFL12401.1 PepSY domain-containing protein [Pusillimonas noertemannii]
MSMASKAKRLMYLAHRWTGIAGCLLMLLWFVSGIVMLYVGYPKLTPWERLAALPELDPQSCCVALDDAADGAGAGTLSSSAGLVLTSIAGKPAYVAQDAGRPAVYDGARGVPHKGPASAEDAMRAAWLFAQGTSATGRHAGELVASRQTGDSGQDAPSVATPWPAAQTQAPVVYQGLVEEDTWTHSRSLDVHRPLHKVEISAPEPVTLYISSRTGQVMLDAPAAQQRWNYVGAWLHWLYAFRSTSSDPVWSWTVIVLSLLGTVSALSGVLVGIWRWRFSHRYKSGSRSPYREPWMKWHHVAGLLFGGFVCTWIFSGLMSMNPVGVFSPERKPDLRAYAGSMDAPLGPLADSRSIIAALREDGFRPVELAWHRLDGQAYVLAHDRRAHSRIVKLREGGLVVARAWTAEEVEPAARRLFPAQTMQTSLVAQHDIYYYQRHPAAMNGALVRGLPALRMGFDDPEHTWVYIDLNTGQVGMSLSRSQRIGRWLFYFLHSWDTPALLDTRTLRDAVLIALSLGGIVVSAAGVVLGWRRLRRRRRAASA